MSSRSCWASFHHWLQEHHAPFAGELHPAEHDPDVLPWLQPFAEPPPSEEPPSSEEEQPADEPAPQRQA